jgi:hypothetical protein
VATAGLRYLAERLRSAALAALQCDVAERDNADKPLLAVYHRQAAHLNVAHVVGDIIQPLILEAVQDFVLHYVAENVLRTDASEAGFYSSDTVDKLKPSGP